MNNLFDETLPTVKVKTKTLTYRKEEFTVQYQYCVYDDTGEEFVTPEMGDSNLSQVYNSYRIKHGIPFPSEIKKIRTDYGLSAAKMSEILGLGANMYRNYESGEMPTESIGHYIKATADPDYFQTLLSYSSALFDNDIAKLKERIKQINEERAFAIVNKEEYIMAGKKASEYTGYKVPDLSKALNLVAYFAEHLKPWQTVLNKLLFYADFGHCKMTGQSITGLAYRAIKFGVVPSNYDKLFAEAVEQKMVNVEYHMFDNSPTISQQYVPYSEQGAVFNPELFSESELFLIKKIVEKFASMSTTEIVEANHQEKAWLDNFQSKAIVSYKESFHLQHI